MENANSKEYLKKITEQVIENLKRTTFVPSVQSTEIPRTTILGGTEEDEDIANDMDEDDGVNKDLRTTKRQFDARVTRDDEFEDSGDEREAAAAYGVRRQTGVNKRRNVMDYKKDTA